MSRKYSAIVSPDVHRGLTRGDGHIARVHHQYGAIDQRPPGLRIAQRGEIVEHFRHLVAALAAADIHDDVRCAVLRERLLEHGLARAKAAGHCDRTAFGNREEKVQHSLPGQKRTRHFHARAHGPRPPHRPVLHHSNRPAGIELDYGVSDRKVALVHGADDPGASRRHEHLQHESAAFLDRAEHVARGNTKADSTLRPEMETLGPIERGCGRAGFDAVARQIREPSQRPADAVDHAAEQPRTEFDCQRMALSNDRLSHADACGLFEDLHCRDVSSDAEYFAEQLPHADADELVQRNAGEPTRLGQGAHHARQLARVHRGLTR